MEKNQRVWRKIEKQSNPNYEFIVKQSRRYNVSVKKTVVRTLKMMIPSVVRSTMDVL